MDNSDASPSRKRRWSTLSHHDKCEVVRQSTETKIKSIPSSPKKDIKYPSLIRSAQYALQLHNYYKYACYETRQAGLFPDLSLTEMLGRFMYVHDPKHIPRGTPGKVASESGDFLSYVAPAWPFIDIPQNEIGAAIHDFPANEPNRRNFADESDDMESLCEAGNRFAGYHRRNMLPDNEEPPLDGPIHDNVSMVVNLLSSNMDAAASLPVRENQVPVKFNADFLELLNNVNPLTGQGGPREGTAKDGPPEGKGQDGPQDGTVQDDPQEGTVQYGPQEGTVQDGPQEGTVQHGPQEGTVKYGTPEGTAQDGRQEGTVQDGSQEGTAQCGVQNGTVQYDSQESTVQPGIDTTEIRAVSVNDVFIGYETADAIPVVRDEAVQYQCYESCSFLQSLQPIQQLTEEDFVETNFLVSDASAEPHDPSYFDCFDWLKDDSNEEEHFDISDLIRF